MKGDRILRTLVIDAERVVGTVAVQGHEVQEDHRENDKREEKVQRVKAVQGRIADRKTSP
jgi:hypothetical protein